LQNRSQTNGDNLKNVRHGTEKIFRNKERKYLEEELVGLKQTVRKKSSTYVEKKNKFKECYLPITNLVKDDNDDPFVDSHTVLNRWKNYFCQLLTLHGINDVRQKCRRLSF
jgi:hypothetical protein